MNAGRKPPGNSGAGRRLRAQHTAETSENGSDMGSIKRNFVYSSILTTANYLFAFLTFPYVSRVLGATNLGICNFVDSITTYFMFFSLMGISIMGIRSIAAAKGDARQLSETFSFLFWLNTLSTAVALAVLLVCVECVPKLHAHRELMYIGAVKVVFNYLAIDWFYKGIEKFDFITKCGVAVRTAYVASVFIFVRKPDDYPVYYMLSALMFAAVAAVNLGYSTRLVKLRLHFSPVRHPAAVKSFFILGFYMLLISMYTTFNVTYLGFACGETEVGYYTAATKLHAILLAVFTAFTNVMLPRMSSLAHDGDMQGFRRLLDKSFEFMLVFSLPLIVLAEVLAPQIVELIAGDGYGAAVVPMRVVVPLIFVTGYEQIIVVQVLMPLKKDRAIFIGSCMGAAVGVAMNLAIVEHLGSTGSAIVWLVSEITVLVCAQYFTSRYTSFRFPVTAALRHAACAVPAALAVLLASRLGGGSSAMSIAAGGAALLAYYAFAYAFVLKEPMLTAIAGKFRRH
jgi:O-antigen/teichoic acid export membrane protein